MTDAAFFDDMDDDALAEVIASMKEEATRLNRMSGMAQIALTQRLKDRGATVFDTEHWTGKVEAGSWIVNDDAGMREVLPLLPAAVRDKAYAAPIPKPPTPKWDHRALNEALKLGGRIADIINKCRVRDAGQLVLERKAKEGIDAAAATE